MTPSKLLKSWLAGNKPSSTREVSALLDESRSLLVSKLPTTALDIQNMAEADIDGVLCGTEGTVLERAVAVHRAAQTKAPKKDRIYELCAAITAQARKPLSQPVTKPVSAAKGRTDKRQGDLPVAQWAFGHLATAAQAGDKLALAELSARGYCQTSNNTFSKRPS